MGQICFNRFGRQKTNKLKYPGYDIVYNGCGSPRETPFVDLPAVKNSHQNINKLPNNNRGIEWSNLI